PVRFPRRDLQPVRRLFERRARVDLRAIFQNLAGLSEHADFRLVGRGHRFQRDRLWLAVLPFISNDGVNRVAIFRKPYAVFVGHHPGTRVINRFAVDEHPERDLTQTVFLFNRQFAVGFWADVEQQVAAFGARFDQRAYQLLAGFVGFVGWLIRPFRTHRQVGFPRALERQSGDELLRRFDRATRHDDVRINLPAQFAQP